MWLAFFFLLHPGEHSASASDSHPFSLSDVQLWSASTPVDPFTAFPAVLLSCTFVTLTFAPQKTGLVPNKLDTVTPPTPPPVQSYALSAESCTFGHSPHPPLLSFALLGVPSPPSLPHALLLTPRFLHCATHSTRIPPFLCHRPLPPCLRCHRAT